MYILELILSCSLLPSADQSLVANKKTDSQQAADSGFGSPYDIRLCGYGRRDSRKTCRKVKKVKNLCMSWPKRKGDYGFSDVTRANDVDGVISGVTVGKVKHAPQTF